MAELESDLDLLLDKIKNYVKKYGNEFSAYKIRTNSTYLRLLEECGDIEYKKTEEIKIGRNMEKVRVYKLKEEHMQDLNIIKSTRNKGEICVEC